MDETAAASMPRAETRRSRRISIVWLLPIVALAIGGWLAWDTLSKEGPTIRVIFDSAEGLQAGQSQLKYKDIVFGTVKSLDLTPDKSHVVVTIATTREAAPLFTENTVFWIVKPRLFAGNISGLDTLLSGAYVGLVPGSTDASPKRDFVGQEDPPILEEHIPGRVFRLKSRRVGSITVGSPIFFRDLDVGKVLGWDVSDMADSVTIQAFVRAPYDAYVHDETRFWNASGVAVKLGAQGVQLQVESMRALLFGGIAFDTPAGEERQPAAVAGHQFVLFADRDTANAASYTHAISAVSYFSGSVRGLGAGSEVSMHGMKIGEVTHVRLIDEGAKGILTKVRYEVQPQRIAGLEDQAKLGDAELVKLLVDRGLRANLETASLLTGQQTVALEFVHNAAPMPVEMDGDRFILPTAEGGGFATLTASATELLNKVNAIPFAQIAGDLDAILVSLDKATRGPALKEAVTNLATALAAAQKALGNANKLAESTNKLVDSVNTEYGHDTKFSRDVDRLLTQTDDTVRAVRALADLMSRHPEALIKGRSE